MTPPPCPTGALLPRAATARDRQDPHSYKATQVAVGTRPDLRCFTSHKPGEECPDRADLAWNSVPASSAQGSLVGAGFGEMLRGRGG